MLLGRLRNNNNLISLRGQYHVLIPQSEVDIINTTGYNYTVHFAKNLHTKLIPQIISKFRNRVK